MHVLNIKICATGITIKLILFEKSYFKYVIKNKKMLYMKKIIQLNFPTF